MIKYFLVAFLLILNFKVSYTDISDRWISNEFEKNIEIITDPAVAPYGNENPQKGQNVNVTIRSKNNQKIELAYITVYAYNWDGTKNPSCPPEKPANWTFKRISNTEMYVIINNYKYFPPGSRVYWRITAYNYTGNITKLVSQWYSYTVGGAWPYNSFDQCIDVFIVPDITSGEAVLAGDGVDVHLDSSKSGIKIGYAVLYVRVKNESGIYEGAIQFFPKNSFTPKLMYKIPGYPAGWRVEFWIEAWDDPNDDRRKLVSSKYYYIVQPGYSWPPNSDFYDNIEIFFKPSLDEVEIGDEVNVTIVSINKSIPIRAAFIEYEVGIKNLNQSQKGRDSFSKISSVHWFYVIPPLSPGAYIRFRVVAYDLWLNPIVSDTYYYEISSKEFSMGGMMAWFYIAVFDHKIPGYVAGAKVIIENESWKCITYTNIAGFCYPNKTGSAEVQYLHFGEYKITVYYKNMVKSLIYTLNIENLKKNPTVTVEFNSPAEPIIYARSVPVQYSTLIISYLIVAVGTVLIILYDINRRKRAEKIRERITI